MMIPSCHHVMRKAAALTFALLLNPAAWAHDTSGWSHLSQTTTCEAGQPNYCHGFYGFQIDHDGHYRVGPTPGGTLIEGSLESSEFEQIDALAHKVRGKMTRSRNTNPGNYLAGSSLHIAMSLPNSITFTAYRWNGDNGNTYYVAEQNDTFALRDALKALMAKYYPRPFPAPGQP